MSEREEHKPQIAERLRYAREAAGLSQGQVARMLGYHRPSISEMEAGRRRVSSDELVRLADIYGVGVGWLAGEETGATGEPTNLMAARELEKLTDDELDELLRLVQAIRSGREDPK
jgi:transcriptional regulator with XRE-family HTH domain